MFILLVPGPPFPPRASLASGSAKRTYSNVLFSIRFSGVSHLFYRDLALFLLIPLAVRSHLV